MRYGRKRSVRAYRVESDKYPEWRFELPLTSVLEIIVHLSNAFDVSIPRLKYRSMSSTSGNYRAFNRTITISSYRNTVRCSTVIHEFAHHLNSVVNDRTGHDEYFLESLDKVYAVANERYSKLLETHKDEVLAHQGEQASVVANQLRRSNEARSKFNLGQRVSFRGRNGAATEGTITRINRKTISVSNCNDGSRGWRLGLRRPSIKILETK